MTKKIPKGFSEREIEIQTTTGIMKVTALVHGPFALHAKTVGLPIEEDLCSVTHLPTGLSLANVFMVFSSVKEAAKAVLAIEQLADWNFTADEKPKEDRHNLGIKVREVASKHGGLDLFAGRIIGADNSKRLNGYERAA